MKLKTTAATLALLVLALACATDEEKQPEGNFINPNGSSELAILMNQLFEEAQTAKRKIARGETPEFRLEAEKILTAVATEPEKVASNEYKAFAASYLESVRFMKNASSAEAADHFNVMASACMNCHQALCPGPTRRIRKLFQHEQ